MQHLAAGMEPGLLAGQVSGLMTRISLMLGSAADDPAEVGQRVRIMHSASRRATPDAFDVVAQATMKRRRLELRYFTRNRNEESERTVSPQQLLHYRENWYLLAWCHRANELRTFALDAVRRVRALNENAREVGPRVLKKAVGLVFGIFTGDVRHKAELRFTANVAPWVGTEVWHPDQHMQHETDGSIRLSVPYGDPRELIMEVLRYGADVEVLAPAELRKDIAGRRAGRAAPHPGKLETLHGSR
jgi:predicted DNA-binding transcriptional regulator YafY